jgi:predicted ATPase/DNA-binding SARP family transcriptional activator
MCKEARAMPTLHIQLLGDFRLSCGGAPVSNVNAPRLQSLLAYLLLHRDAPQPRQHLAFRLWPDTSEAQARTNLRQLLHALKQALPAADHFVHADAQTLRWRSDAPFHLDVAEFEQALSQADAAEQQRDAHGLRVALEQASAVYQGDLLPSCYDDWIVPERERLRQAFTGALQRLLLLLESQGELRAAIACAQRLVRHDPLHEETYRGLMRLYAACGDRAGVVRVYQTCATVLERELAVEPSAATREAYEQLLKVDVQARPVLPPQPSNTNLPVPLTSFVGRAAEMAEVIHLLQTTRLLTLSGPGGTGKTRLALEVATKLLDEYPNGVWLVELAPLADPTLVAQTMAATLGVREQPRRPILDALLDYVRTKTLLLILDNCEHLIETCAQMADTMLRVAPGLKIMASSREPLGIGGETAYRVPPLALPDPRQLHDLDTLAQNDCVRLFVDRASAAYPPFRLTAKNAPAIAQICLRLDGIPLAIELAAARTKLFPPEQIAARLDDRFRLLTGGSRTALERHQTLRALIDWSYDLLSEAERVLLRRLSVFAGGWSFEAAQAVCGEGLGDAVLDLLSHLVDKSLVVVEEQAEAEEARYRLLETIRQYAREKLLESGEAGPVRDRHLEFFLRFAEEAEPKLRGAEQLAWLERIETEHYNLRTALAWALESGEATAGLRLAGALWLFWDIHSHQREGLTRLEGLLAITSNRTLARAKALFGAGLFRYRQGEYGSARTLLQESLSICRELGDKRGSALSLDRLSSVAYTQGNYAESLLFADKSLALYQELDDWWGIAHMLNGKGELARLQGDYEAAGRFYEEGLALSRELGDQFGICVLLHNLAYVVQHQGDYPRAAMLFKEGLILCQQVGEKVSAALAVAGLAGIAGLTGQPERAARMFAAAQAALDAFGIVLDAVDRSDLDRDIQTMRSQMDETSFSKAWAEGRALTIEQAIALATENERGDSQLPQAGLGSGSA